MIAPLLYLCLSANAARQTAQSNLGYYMQPSIRGNTIVFASQGDIWKVGADGGLAHPLTSHVAPASSPALSPDGRTVAFTGTYEGPRDAYVMSIDGGVPKRLSYDGLMNVIGWTPSGKVLAATTTFSLPSPELTTLDPGTRSREDIPLYDASNGVYDETGKTLFFTRHPFQGSHTMRYKGGTAQSLWKYTEGAPEAIPLTADFTGTSKDPMWWNHAVYFISDRDGWMNLWSSDENGGHLKQLTHSESWDVQSASMDKGRIVYQLGADLHLFDVTTGEDKTLKISLAGDFDQSRERWIKTPMQYLTNVDQSVDGEKVVLTARGQVFVAPVEPGRLVEVTRKSGVRYRSAIFSQDGKSVLTLSDESGEAEWWRYPANGVGAGEQLTHGATVLSVGGKLSPNGNLLAYNDKNQNLWIYDLTTKKTTKVLTCPDGDVSDLAWSPDSQWLSYTMPTISFSRVEIYSVKTGVNTPVTSDRSDSSSAAWSPDGKWLYFLSDRTFKTTVESPWGSRQPEPYFDRITKIYMLGLQKGLRSPFQPNDELTKPPETETPSKVVTTSKPLEKVNVTNRSNIDFDGIQTRQWEVPITSGNYGSLSLTADKIFATNRTAGTNSTDLISVDIKNKDVKLDTVVPGIDGYSLSGDRKKLLVTKGGAFLSYNAAAPAAPATVDLSGWSFSIQPREEWRQMFIEAWRLERDYFYNPKLNSLDWHSVLDKYLPLVDRVGGRAELSNLLGQMIGELSTLHMFVYGGDTRTSQESVSTAFLGGEFSRNESLGGYRVDKIYQSDPDYPLSVAPLAKPDVAIQVGDVIQSVNGVNSLDVPNMEALLRNQAGKQVLLHVKDGKSGQPRDCLVVPINTGQLRDLQYGDWELSRRQTVDQESKQTIGYVHLRAMTGPDMEQWERDFYPVFNRSGLIIDVRHNNGGNIDSWILEKLLRKAWFYWQPRVGNPSWNMQWAFRGHVVVLCDDSTASDGEAFSEGFKRLGLGKVIGTRTWGGEVWLSEDNVLRDNGIATAAETGVYGPEGKWLVEGHGVDPDIVVDNLPHATFEGKDAQLEAALAYLAKEIHDHPIPVPPNPPYPNKVFPAPKGKGG